MVAGTATGGSTMNNQRITSHFGAQSTAAEVIARIDLTGRRAIVTGGASGIGVETARALASANAEVTLAVRNLEAGERVADDIVASTGNKQVLVAPLDLADPGSIGALVARWSGPLHLLVNNAGVMRLPELQLTPDGWEMQFARNHLRGGGDAPWGRRRHHRQCGPPWRDRSHQPVPLHVPRGSR